MMKISEIRKRKAIIILIITIIFFILVTILTGVLLARITTKMNNSTSETFLASSRIIKEGLNNKISLDEEILITFSELIASEPTSHLEYTLQNYINSSGFYKITYLDMNGKGIDSTGNPANLTELPFTDTALTNGQHSNSPAYHGNSGWLEIAYQTPVMKNDTQIGALYAQRILEDFNSQSLFMFHNGQGLAYVIDSDNGEWLITCKGDRGSDTLYGFLKDGGNQESTLLALQNAISEGKSGTITIQYHKTEYLLCFLPLDTPYGSCLITTIPKSIIQHEAFDLLDILKVLLLVLLAAGILISLLVAGRQSLKARSREREYREKLFENLSTNIDFAFMLYTPATHKTELLSNNISEIIGVPVKQALKSPEIIFQYFGPEMEEMGDAFLNGRLTTQCLQECKIGDGPDEIVRWIAVHMIPADYNQYLAVFHDTTKEHHMRETLADALEQARNTNQARTLFFSSISHDIRTPMNGIIGMTNIAMSNLDHPEKVSACLQKILTASDHLLALINEILDMSRIESGKINLKEEQIELPTLISNILSFIKPEIQRKHHELMMKSSVLEHDTFIGDALNLQKVFLNLLSNAVKYTPDGGHIIFCIEELKHSQDIADIRFIVEDNGIGMSEDFMKRIFQPFERAEDSRMSKTTGTGLGMSITKGIIDSMGGHIQIESQIDKGSRFTVEIPLKLPPDSTAKPPFFGRYPVLLASTDTEALDSISQILDGTGLKTDWAASSLETSAKVEEAHQNQEDYFIIIIENRLTPLSGIETARQIRSLKGGSNPIILLSTYDEEEIKEDASSAGIDGFLTKPYFKNELLETLMNYMPTEDFPTLQPPSYVSHRLAPHLSGLRILAAEDNELNREIICELLTAKNVQVLCVENGKEALEEFEKSAAGDYQMILLDIHMPVMDGLETSRSIRSSSHPDASVIPIIAMTADVFDEDIHKSREAGMDGHLSKPIVLEELFAIINQFKEGRKGVEEKE
ncbi:MAG: response regulator [Faecalicatena sp.]|uniref:ATP-binding response regulator n=1 Tax=Faecalicatena sp. TaxID=2005360 RepID=UPI00258E89D9|nr:response regulator [Faecalicatena sp.]MCI6465407.1 response regulator [Faecalicatena sp.]MDY5617239.1 response regulator [Lachnospiraceae bacterium]